MVLIAMFKCHNCVQIYSVSNTGGLKLSDHRLTQSEWIINQMAHSWYLPVTSICHYLEASTLALIASESKNLLTSENFHFAACMVSNGKTAHA